MRHVHTQRLWPSVATSKGPLQLYEGLDPTAVFYGYIKNFLPVPLQKNLDQRNTPQALPYKSELEDGVLPGTPSLPCDNWLPYRIVGGMSLDQW